MAIPNIHDNLAYERLALDILVSPFYYDGEGPALPFQPKRVLMLDNKPIIKKSFGNIEKTEHPDLQSDKLDLGIEVTMAISFDEAQDLDTFDKAKAQDAKAFTENLARIDKKNKFKPKVIQNNLPEPISYGIYIDQTNAHQQITKCIEAKNKKAKKYKKFADNWLFIFCPFTLDENKALDAINKVSEKGEFNMYILSSWTNFGELLYVHSPYDVIEKRHHYNIGDSNE